MFSGEEIREYFLNETQGFEIASMELIETKHSYFDTIGCYHISTVQEVDFYVFTGDTTMTNLYPVRNEQTLDELYYMHVGFVAEYSSMAVGRNFVLDFIKDSQLVHLILRTAAKLDMSFSVELFCSFVLIPSFLFGESDPTAFPQYLLDHIPEEEMEKLVLHNIRNEELREGVAAAHLNYCTEHRLYGAKDFAKSFLSTAESEGYRYSALNYISELYGIDVLLDEVVPLCNNERFLLDVAYHIPLHISTPMLDEKLESALKQNPTTHLVELMIRRNHKSALDWYYEQAEGLKTLPDMTEGSLVPSITESLRYVNSIELIGAVIKLLRLINQPDFTDKDQSGLRDACWKSIINMASVNYDEVKTALTIEKNQTSDNQKLTCIDLLQRIEELYQFSIDKGIEFELALVLTTD